jgi:carboxymethylenebutenolidase
MAPRIDYYFTPMSPWTFLGSERFHRIAAKAGAEIRYRPVDYGRIFPASGGLPVRKRAPQRQAYRLMELKRWAEHTGIPLIVEPVNFPQPDELAALTLIAADEAGADMAGLCTALGHALWVEDRVIDDPATLRELLARHGASPDLIDRARSDEIKARRDAYNEEALAIGVFGAPTYVLDGELFWGQDRLDFLERRLATG